MRFTIPSPTHPSTHPSTRARRALAPRALAGGLFAAATLLAPTATLAPTAALAADPVPVVPAADPGRAERVKVGVLACDIEGGFGFIIASSKRLACRYNGVGGAESYRGRVTRVGADIGVTGKQVLSWTVFAPATTDVFSGLEGGYAGVGANAAIGVGFGTNVLLGGSGRRIVLQPISIQTGTGVNAAAGITGLSLDR